MAFLGICFKGDVCISHAALSHFAHRHTRDSLVKHLYAPVCHSYLPVFQLYVLLCVNPNVPICYSVLPLCTCTSLVWCFSKIPFSFVKKYIYIQIIKSLPFHESITLHNQCTDCITLADDPLDKGSLIHNLSSILTINNNNNNNNIYLHSI